MSGYFFCSLIFEYDLEVSIYRLVTTRRSLEEMLCTTTIFGPSLTLDQTLITKAQFIGRYPVVQPTPPAIGEWQKDAGFEPEHSAASLHSESLRETQPRRY